MAYIPVIGEKVRVVRDTSSHSVPIGAVVVITDKTSYSDDRFYQSFNGCYITVEEIEPYYEAREAGAEAKELKGSCNKKTMSLIDKFKIALKAEPEKSFIQKGVMNSDESFTSEGQELFNLFLYNKFKDEFKKEVVDKIETED